MYYWFLPSAGNCNPPMDYDSCHHLLVEKNYPPPPVGRAPSPPNEDEGEPFFVSDCHQYNSVGNARYIPKEVNVRSIFVNTHRTVASTLFSFC